MVEILLPHIGGLYLGGGARSDYIIYPHHAGRALEKSGYGRTARIKKISGGPAVWHLKTFTGAKSTIAALPL